MVMDPLLCRNIAHRGASAYYPENSMIAFEKALEMGAHMLEFDVTASSDLQPLILHDDTLDRTTDGKGHTFNYTMDEIKGFNICHPVNNYGQKVPHLKEVLATFGGRVCFNIEIKKNILKVDYYKFLSSVIDYIKDFSLESDVLISSFSPKIIKTVKSISPLLKTALIYDNKILPGRYAVYLLKKTGADAFHCDMKFFNSFWLKSLSEYNITTNVFTVDEPSHMENLLNMAVNGIFTNKPDLLSSLL